MSFFDRLGDRLEGKGRTILYAFLGLVCAIALISALTYWNNRKRDEARRALGHAIEIASAPILPAPVAGSPSVSFPNERARAESAVKEFNAVAAKYPDPFRENARYLAAVNQLTLDRNEGLRELEKLATSSSDKAVSTLAKFALAQAKEMDGQYDTAAALYGELAKQTDGVIPADTANLRLAAVYEKQGKKKEAADLLYNIVQASRKAKGADGKLIPPSGAARDAALQLEKLDPTRYSQLPPEPLANEFALS
jgi:tetratricopeptide (TPR) repeat protein